MEASHPLVAVIKQTKLIQSNTIQLYLNQTGYRSHVYTYVRVTNVRVINSINLLRPNGYVMHQQFNIQQLYALPTLYLCVLCLSENKQRLVPLTA